MKYYNFLSFFLLGIIIAFFNACNDDNEEAGNLACFQKSGYVAADFTYQDEKYEQKITILNRGMGTFSTQIAPYTQEEMAAYNLKNGTDYHVMPESTYKLSETNLTFVDSEKSKEILITMFPKKLFEAIRKDTETKQYALPLHVGNLNSNTCVIYVVNMDYPILKLSEEEIPLTIINEEEEVLITACTYEGQKATESIPNKGNVSLDLTISNNAEEWVKKYNAEHNTEYRLLPSTAYEFGKMTGMEGEDKCTATIKVKHTLPTGEPLEYGNFILPLQLAGIDDHVALAHDTCIVKIINLNGYDGKELFFPEGLWNQTSTEFLNPTSRFNVHYGKIGDNIALLWDRNIGVNPLYAPSHLKFDPNKALAACEETYNFLVDELEFANRTTSYAAKYKIICRVHEDGAHGWGKGNVGIFEVIPSHFQDPRYSVPYHEMCHTFEFFAMRDGAAQLSGSIVEMTAQWAILRRFPNWIEFNRSPFNVFMQQTHLSLLHEDNEYNNPYILEYWASKHGVNMVSRIWKEAIQADNSDPVVIYKRLTNIDQEQFNNEIYDAAARFITWDLPHIEKEYARYGGTNVHTCELKRTSPNDYQIVPKRCPSNYGYNGIKLAVPTSRTTIQLTFQGMMNAPGFNPPVNSQNKGWRFGFLAVKNNGERVYGEMGKVTEGSSTIDFTIPENTKHLWLIVTGAPTKHWKHNVDHNNTNDEQWPYTFKLLGTKPDGQYCKVNN